MLKLNDRVLILENLIEEELAKMGKLGNTIDKLIFQLYARIKRLHQTCSIIRNSGMKGSYFETLPNLRVLLEHYIHLKYIVLAKDKTKIIEQYQEKGQNFLYETVKNYKELIEWKGNTDFLHLDEAKIIEDNQDMKKPNDETRNLKELSKRPEVNEFEAYVRAYKILNSSIHFDPFSHALHGHYEGDTFQAGSFKDDPNIEKTITKLEYGWVFSSYSLVVNHFQFENIEEHVIWALKHWQKVYR